MTEPTTCSVCENKHFRSNCPKGPHDWWGLLDDSKKENAHRESESSSVYRDNHREDDGWDAAREVVLERDGQQCVICGCTQQEHRDCDDLFGAGLHVHHIIPAREFDVLAEAHDGNNLITLCGYCHRKADSGQFSIERLKQYIQIAQN